ncbi:MAG: hypothetical protein V4733_01320 [Verrucomicrobiota bacterium]
MTEPENNPLGDLLSSFALGPAWARAQPKPADSGKKSRHEADEPGDRPHDKRARRDNDGRRDNRDDRRRDGFRTGRDPRSDDRPGGPPVQEEAPPAPGVHVSLEPTTEAVQLIGKEIHHVARVYPLYDVAQILLANRGRCRVLFEVSPKHPPLLRGTKDDSLFLTREEALHHLWNSPLKNEFVEEETIETDPPSGNFQVVARCGISGEWLGPPNFHSYQTNLRRLHRERFADMPFERFASRVRTERSEEVVNAWLETMKHKTRWRAKGAGDDAWIEDRAEAEKRLGPGFLDQAFAETRAATLPGELKSANLSRSLFTSLRLAASHIRKHPAILIPAVCRAVEAEHLPVFKRQGKLFTGPARPHPLPQDAILAERPGIMVEWIRANKPAKLEGLWKAVLPDGATAPPAEFAADLFWLLIQGHVLLFTDDTLVVQEIRTPTPAATPTPGEPTKSKRRKKKKSPGTPASSQTEDAQPTPEEPPEDSAPSEMDPPVSSAAEESPAEAPPVQTASSNDGIPVAENPDNSPAGVDDTRPV